MFKVLKIILLGIALLTILTLTITITGVWWIQMNIIDVLHLFFSLRYDKFNCVIIGHGLFAEVMEQMKKESQSGWN